MTDLSNRDKVAKSLGAITFLNIVLNLVVISAQNLALISRKLKLNYKRLLERMKIRKQRKKQAEQIAKI